jgi:type I restriction enzyme S subunit
LLEERNEQAPESEEYPLMAFIANEGVAPKGERYDRGALVKDAENKNYKKTDWEILSIVQPIWRLVLSV